MSWRAWTNLTEMRAARHASSRPLIAVGIGVAAVAAMIGVPSRYGIVAFLLIAPVTLLMLWLAEWKLPGAGRDDVLPEGYGVLVVASAVTLFMVPLGVLAGPITILALALLVLGIRGRDLSLAFPAFALLLAPIDVRGAIARLSPGLREPLVAYQVAAAIALLAGGFWLHRRETAIVRSRGAMVRS